MELTSAAKAAMDLQLYGSAEAEPFQRAIGLLLDGSDRVHGRPLRVGERQKSKQEKCWEQAGDRDRFLAHTKREPEQAAEAK